MRLQHAMTGVGAEVIAAFSTFNAFDYLHERAFDAVVLNTDPDPDLAGYLDARIKAFEDAGASWAVFRWTSGWAPYERVEAGMAVSEHPAALARLRQAWSRNRARPG